MTNKGVNVMFGKKYNEQIQKIFEGQTLNTSDEIRLLKLRVNQLEKQVEEMQKWIDIWNSIPQRSNDEPKVTIQPLSTPRTDKGPGDMQPFAPFCGKCTAPTPDKCNVCNQKYNSHIIANIPNFNVNTSYTATVAPCGTCNGTDTSKCATCSILKQDKGE